MGVVRKMGFVKAVRLFCRERLAMVVQEGVDGWEQDKSAQGRGFLTRQEVESSLDLRVELLTAS
jgi:hypothetical protein